LKQDVPIWKQRTLAKLDVETGVAPRAPTQVSQGTARSPAAHSAAEVLALLRKLCLPLETERVALADATGRVLREAVCAPEDQPPFDRSSMDGYAVRLNDRATQFRVVDGLRAGDWKPRALQPGEAVRIATGSALPGDGLRVLMKEDVRVEDDTLTVSRPDHQRNIRCRGEDARAGQELAGAGTVLQPGALGLLASVGCAQPLVTRRPRVLHIATGNELVPPDQTLGRGQIRDSNSTLVRAFLGRWGVLPEQARGGEDRTAIQAAMTHGRWPMAKCDLLLISGGASVGEHDFTRNLLEGTGFTIHVSKTTARPGKPLIVAQRGNTLAFGLPGNPLAHFVCLNLYVRAALEAFAGLSSRFEFHRGVLATDLAAGGNVRETFWPGHWHLADGTAALTPLPWNSSGDLTSLATANALIRVAGGAGRFMRGQCVEFVFTEVRV
jgi:molybdopterin molybdotransferase